MSSARPLVAAGGQWVLQRRVPGMDRAGVAVEGEWPGRVAGGPVGWGDPVRPGVSGCSRGPVGLGESGDLGSCGVGGDGEQGPGGGAERGAGGDRRTLW